MHIGMLWNGTNVHAAKQHYINKYKRIPDTIELSPEFAKKFEIKNKEIDGLRVAFCKGIQFGNILIGVESDTNNLEYLKTREG